MKKKEENKENTNENNTLSKDKNKINGISTSTNPEDIIKSNIDNIKYGKKVKKQNKMCRYVRKKVLFKARFIR